MLKIPYLPGLHLLCGRAPKSSKQRLVDKVDQIRNSLPGQLPKLFSSIIEPEKITGGEGSRERIFSAAATLFGMCGQVLRGNGSLRSALEEAAACQQLRLGRKHTETEAHQISSSTGSYSDARARLPKEQIEQANQRVCNKMDWGWTDLFPGRRILVADGTSFKVEDTPANQATYSQPAGQAPGCGFPVVQVVGLFDARSHALCALSLSPHSADEGGMFDVDLAGLLQPGDIAVLDRGGCSYQRIAGMVQKNVDTVMRVHASRSWPKEYQNKDDCLMTWKRPPSSARPAHLSLEEWKALPAEITVRLVRHRVERKGFRSSEILLVTTLTDDSVPAEDIAEVYLRRWQIELCFDDIKTTLQMSFIRAKSPAMVEKMILTCMLVYNLVRHLIQQSLKACSSRLDPSRISFKSTLESLNSFTSEGFEGGKRALCRLQKNLYERIARHKLPCRPNRIEPRVQKLRPKPFPFMTKPRHELRLEIETSMLILDDRKLA